jgi:hypothetical protein
VFKTRRKDDGELSNPFGFFRLTPVREGLILCINRMTDKEENKIVTMDQEEALRTLVSVFNPDDLKRQLKVEQERRELLSSFIKQNLTDGVDYGKIHTAGKDRCQKPWECKNEHHFSKPCLFKPGAEKFCSLLQLRAEFTPDKETIEMVGGPAGLIAFRCELRQTSTGITVAEGRGACSISEKGGMVNTTLKIAEKRAHIDAVLRLGLSDSFTQDLEEMKLPEGNVPVPAIEIAKASKKELDDIRLFAFVKRVDMKKVREYAKSEFGSPFDEVNTVQASRIKDMLEAKYGKFEPAVA